MQENILDLITVKFGDSETTARPYKFLEDDKGNLVKATLASTSCPDCGHGIDVDVEYWHGGDLHATCDNCGSGMDYYSKPQDNIDANASTVFVDKNIRSIEDDILDALKDEVDEESKIDEEPKIGDTGKIKIDMPTDIKSVENDCPFVDPIDLGLFVLDEI